MLRWNPHFHAIVLEGGFDEQGTFVYIPLGHLQAMTELLRCRVVTLLVAHKLLDRRFARNMLSWRHSGFSIDNSVRTSSTLWTSLPSSPSTSHRRGCNSSVVMVCTPRAARATGRACPTFYSGRHQDGRVKMTRTAATASNRAGSPEVPATETDAPDARERRHAWARLLARVYEVDPLVCPRCGARLRVIAVIQNPVQIKKILNHLVRAGRSPPGIDPTTLD